MPDLPSPLLHLLFKRIDISPIVAFRILFGGLMFFEAAGAIAIGWVDLIFNDPEHNFTFIGFEWLEQDSSLVMYFWFAVMAWCAAMVAYGWYYRPHMVLLTLLWAGTYFQHKVGYNNHHYLLLLLCGFMCCIDAHRYCSLDVMRDPSLRRESCPNWYRLIFIFQLAIVFFFASKAKVYPGWLEGNFIGTIFQRRADHWLYGDLLLIEQVQTAIAYGGIVFDLVIIPMLVWCRTRKFAFVGYLLFNLINATIFDIGVFPWLVIATSVLFFEPDTIRKILFKRKVPVRFPLLSHDRINLSTWTKFGMFLFGIYFLLQVVLPLRHHLIAGNVLWTEEGHRLSWRMMLRTKYAEITYTVKSKDGLEVRVKPEDFLSKKQSRVVPGRPDMIWQAAQILRKRYEAEGHPEVQVYADCFVSVNGRPLSRFIDPSVDLAHEKWHIFRHEDWIMPSPIESKGFSLN